MVPPILMYRSSTCFFANEPDMRSIDIDSCFCLTSFFDEHKSQIFDRNRRPINAPWRSFLGHRWMFYHRHNHYWPYVEIFFVFGEYSISVTTIEDDLKKFPWPSVNVLSSAPPFWPFEEMFFAFGVSFFRVTTIEDDSKKFPWPSVNMLSSAPPFLTIWRNVLHLQGRRRSFDILAINHSSFFEGDIFRDLNRLLHFSPSSVTEIVDVDHEVLVVYLKTSDQLFFQPHKWSLQLYHKSDIQSHYRKNKIYLIPWVYSA